MGGGGINDELASEANHEENGEREGKGKTSVKPIEVKFSVPFS